MKADKKNWLRLLAYVTGSINQELLLRNEYLAGRELHFEIADQRTIAVVRWREGNLGGDSRCRKFRAHGRLSICYGGKRKRWAELKKVHAEEAAPVKKRKLSAAGRKRIIEATKKRWAEYNAKKAAGKK